MPTQHSLPPRSHRWQPGICRTFHTDHWPRQLDCLANHQESSFPSASDELQKRRADAVKQLGETPADQTDKRAQLERSIRRFDALLTIKLSKSNRHLFERYGSPASWATRGCSVSLYPGTRAVMCWPACRTQMWCLRATWDGERLCRIWSMQQSNDWIPSLDTLLRNIRLPSSFQDTARWRRQKRFVSFATILTTSRTRVKESDRGWAKS